ncbi:MAG: helix-turn-helix transcriptional regulator [Caulobacteraceae bacterium]
MTRPTPLTKYRKSLGLSQAGFAKMFGLSSKSYISDLERGRQEVPLKLALEIQQVSKGTVPAASICPAAAALLNGQAGLTQ